MVITTLQGGVGNQLFQYAAGRSVAERTGKTLFLDRTFYRNARNRNYELNAFLFKGTPLWDGVANVINGNRSSSKLKRLVKRSIATRMVRLVDAHAGYDPRIESVSGHCRLSGYWQSERYLIPIREKLLSEFKLRNDTLARHHELISRIQSAGSVAVHVRRGDLVQSDHYRENIGTLTRGYYEAAIEQILAEVSNPEFFVFTDDVDWAQQHIRSIRPPTLISGRMKTTAAEDLVLMSCCRHFIIANSTFSWWGAWLSTNSQKVVISPARFFRVDRLHEVNLLPPSWRKIQTELSNRA